MGIHVLGMNDRMLESLCAGVVKPPVNNNTLARPLAHLVACSLQVLVTRLGPSST